MITNFMCQLGWAMMPRFVVKHYFVSVRVLLDEINV